MFARNRALILKVFSAMIVFGAWEVAGRIPVSFAFPTFLESSAAFYTLSHRTTTLGYFKCLRI